MAEPAHNMPPNPAGDPPEARRAPRRRVLKGVQIVSLNKMSTFDCTLRNLSRTGALVVVPSATGIPQEFYLLAPGQSRLTHCQVVWRTANRLGIKFLSEADHLLAS